MLYLSYFNKLKNIREVMPNAYIIAVASRVPPGCEKFLDEHYVHLKPNESFRYDYQAKKISFLDFRNNYIEQVRNSKKMQDSLVEIKKSVLSGKDVVLVCFEKEYKGCHRLIDAEIMFGLETGDNFKKYVQII